MSVVEDQVVEEAFAPAEAARRLVRARRDARALDGYPGAQPSGMMDAYAVQDAALAAWPEPVAGWKLGRIAPDLVARYGAGRLAGPIFTVWTALDDAPVVVPVFAGGFAAVEAEYVLRIGRDPDPHKRAWTRDEAAEVVDAMFVGVEMAGSPLPAINDYGPAVVASDFGNNNGLILGREIQDWRARSLDSLRCATEIDGREVGRGGASAIPDGPVDSVRFLLELAASRGRPLRRGDLVSTGAATGIHEIGAGQSARADFGGDGVIAVRTEPARPAA